MDASPPPSLFPRVAPLSPSDGWCDAVGDPLYNCPVTLPYPASAEALWRDDCAYDVIVVLGHNDDPAPVSGAGSAIFFHVVLPGAPPTSGCIALPLPDLLEVLRTCGPGTIMTVT